LNQYNEKIVTLSSKTSYTVLHFVDKEQINYNRLLSKQKFKTSKILNRMQNRQKTVEDETGKK